MDEFEKIIGYADIKRELKNICDIMVNPEKYKRLGVTTPRGLLLSGDPGVGKTLMANCFIKASGRKPFTCRKMKPDGEFVKEIKSIFDQAVKAAPSIVFLDDMDKFANGDERHRNSEEYVTIQTCIDELKGKEVFVIATINEQDCLPDSLLRAGRFDRMIEVEAPEGKEAREIISYYLSKKNFVADMDVELIADMLGGASCATLETVVNEAGILAGYQGKDTIDMDDITRACMSVVFEAPESTEEEPYERTIKIAYHEAGHAVVAEMLAKDDVVIVSVMKHSGGTGGTIKLRRGNGNEPSVANIENQIGVALGGRAATEIVYGECDMGATKDIEKAFRLAEGLTDIYCLGGFDKKSMKYGDASDAVHQRKESYVHNELERQYGAAKQVLIANREFLDRLAHLLAEKKTLTGKEIKALKNEIYGKPSDISPDETYKTALMFCIKSDRASVSMLQRELNMSYVQACKIIDWMESKGYITPANGTIPRKVLLSENEYNKLFKAEK